MGFLRWIIGFLLAIDVTAFAVLNTHDVEVFWSPVHPPLDIPLYLISLLMAAVAFVLGGVMVWLNSSDVRRIKRQQRRQIKALEKELDEAKDSARAAAPPSDFFPALPKQAAK